MSPRKFRSRSTRRANGPNFRFSNTIGGARPDVQRNSEEAQQIADTNSVPNILASIYKPPASVNTNDVINAVDGEPKTNQIYVPVTKKGAEEVRPISEKLKSWILRGVWA